MTEQLVRSMRVGRTVHAHILEGGQGTGKRTLAGICARALNCSAPEDQRPCGVCSSCLRAEAGNHPDIHFVRPPMERGKERSIGVDKVREIIENVSVRPYEGGCGAVIIERAGMMTIPAQNALLKTLESPPENVVFFLLTETASVMLPTIISRCRVTRMPMLSWKQVKDVLVNDHGIMPIRAEQLADIAAGSVGEALLADRDDNVLQMAERAISAVLSVKTAADVPDASAMLKDDKDRSMQVLDLMEQFARDRMLYENGAEPYAKGRRERIAQATISGKKLLMGVISARQLLKSNVSWQSALEMVLIGICK